MIRQLLKCLFLAALALSGCRSTENPGIHPSSAQTAANPTYKVYKLHGKVVSIDTTKGEMTLDHDAIPGYMEAMTMPYKLKDPSQLSKFHQGDVITADVLVSQDADANILLDHLVVVAQTKS